MAGQHGYAGKILRVDLSTGDASYIETAQYADRFVGGRGIASRIYWEEVPLEVGALDPGNRLMFFTGPVTGFGGLGASRWTVCGKSPLLEPEQFSYCSLAGDWGVRLKFAGYDGIVVQGKADRPVYIYIEDDDVVIRDASALWGRGAIETREILQVELGKGVSVAACGPGGENMVSFATILADRDASGSSGFGAVMGSKNLKAIAVSGSGGVMAADPEGLADVTGDLRRLLQGHGGVRDFPWNSPKIKKDSCRGCIGACPRMIFETDDGMKGKFQCGAGSFYMELARRFYGELNEVPFHAARMCNEYGLDALHVIVLIMWLGRCQRAGVLNDENTGLPLSRMGSMEFIEALLSKISLREDFGENMAGGLHRAPGLTGKGTEEFITDYVSKAGHATAYCPRMYISTGVLYAVEPRMPIQQVHQIGTALFAWRDWANKVEGSYLSSELFRKIAARFWGGELAVDFSTYEGKARAAAIVQDREYAKESMILCDWIWPVVHVRNSEDHMGDPALESRVFSAVTGVETDEDELYHIGERLLNMQRAVLAREGHRGRDGDTLAEAYYTRPLKTAVENPECIAPGKDGELISRKGAVVDRESFKAMMDEYYSIRGWDVATGLQTMAKLDDLGLGDIAGDLEQRGLIAGL